MRIILFCAATLLWLVPPAEAQLATYTDHWVDEEYLADAPEGWTGPQYSVGTTESAYDPYEEYQIELKMYDNGALVDRVWSNWDPTYASVVGTSYIAPDFIPTPIANCAEADHWIYKRLQDVRERFARTNSETQIQRVETRYLYTGPRGDGLQEYYRDQCYSACSSARYCHVAVGNYLRGWGILASDPLSGWGACKISHRVQQLRPGCQGPVGVPVTGDNGCPED